MLQGVARPAETLLPAKNYGGPIGWRMIR